MDSPADVRTRFAPSPTGFLHVGGARTALFCWLLAHHSGGKYLLRIEDTDLARSTTESVDALLDDLAWLGISRDNEELVFQSKRVDVYNQIIDGLIAKDLAYKAYETTEELNALRKSAEQEKRTFVYKRAMMSDADRVAHESLSRPHVVRFAMPAKTFSFHDAVLDKDVTVAADQVQDFVIRKTNGMPTYHFAVVVDDEAMKITHVLRGQEHLLNTINHIALMDALGYSRPIFGHLPVILNTDGSKMGKRDRDKKVRQAVGIWLKDKAHTIAHLSAACGFADQRLDIWINDSKSQLNPSDHEKLLPHINLKQSDLPEILVHDFRKNGYLPEALINFLALLGWNPGDDRERMTLDELIAAFTLSGVGKANAKFDRAKLLAFNTEACAAATPARLLAAFRDYLDANPDAPQRSASDDELLKLLSMKRGFRTLREVDEPTRNFFVDDEKLTFDPAAVEKVLKKDGAGFDALRGAREEIRRQTDWSAFALESAIKSFAESRGLGLGKIAQPLRVAITGSTVSPPLFDSLEFLGKERSIRRIDRCLATQNLQDLPSSNV